MSVPAKERPEIQRFPHPDARNDIIRQLRASVIELAALYENEVADFMRQNPGDGRTFKARFALDRAKAALEMGGI